jgi:small-conductance mechanosensitive channel
MPLPCAVLVTLLAAAGAPVAEVPGATLTVANRDVLTFRATVGGIGPAARLRAAQQRIEDLPEDALEAPVTFKPVTLGDARGVAVLVGSRFAFGVAEGDGDPLSGESTEAVASAAADRLAKALRASREQRSVKVLLQGLWQSAAATAVALLLLAALVRLRRAIVKALSTVANLRAAKVLGGRVDLAPIVAGAVRGVVFAAFWSSLALLLNVWFTFVLGRFPLTAPWADVLGHRVLGILAAVGLATLGAIPGLVAVAVMFLVARSVARFLQGVFERLERGTLSIPGVYPETASATRRIVNALVWLVALAAAYPYIPGADSQAVKGLSVLVGVMLSLGSTGLVAQAMSGLALVYSRALSAGDVVRIGEVEGLVSKVGLLSTKIITLPGEEVTLPNSVVLSGAVRNATRLSEGKGPLLTTAVTIGYDAPWRQVHALLLGAAGETAGLVRDPAPYVLQRALGDFYVEYQLVVRLAADPVDRARVLSELHAHVQDAFNAAGVQIMSPHYVLQPKEPVVVPPERWDGGAPSPPLQRVR